MFPTLRVGDGFARIAIEKRDAVLRMQRALVRASFELEADGLFGQETRAVVLRFQRQMGLTPDGIVGPATWGRLKPYLRVGERQYGRADIQGRVLQDFEGDLQWVHAREGHAGRPYWPGGASGVTLDPGFDLAHQSEAKLRRFYPNLSDSQRHALIAVLGLKGRAAKSACRRSDIASIRTSKERALTVMPIIADKYWRDIRGRFPCLVDRSAPPCIHTVMLSLAYNRGPNNGDLEVLRVGLESSDWLGVANLVGNMQQNHSLAGIRRRRRLEADYIESELQFGLDGHAQAHNGLLYDPEEGA